MDESPVQVSGIERDNTISEIGRLLAEKGISDGDTPANQGEGEHQNVPPDLGAGSGAEQGDENDLAAGLEGDTEGEAADDSGEPARSGDEDEEEPITVSTLAEKLGVEAKDIYDELQIPVGEGESITLGEFKDRAKDLRELDAQREEYQANKSDYEKGQMRDRALLNEMLEIVGPDIARPALEAAQRRVSGWEEEQRGLILDAIPEWKDPDNLARDRSKIVTVGQEYGFSEVEITHTQDSRTVRMLRDFALMREQIESAKAESKKQRTAPGKPGRANRTSKRGALSKVLNQAKQSSDSGDKARGVAALLQNEGLA
jgi:hypothetical protein